MAEQLLQSIRERATNTGGFASHPRETPRSDCTAWAALALCTLSPNDSLIKQANGYLRGRQQPDGSVEISEGIPKTHWATALAILAWHRSGDEGEHSTKAVRYLLTTHGETILNAHDGVTGHNTELKGWSWDQGSHSWLEPTSYSLIALKTVGEADSPRVKEGARVLLDRQLSEGGWNYGSKSTYGVEHSPLPDFTGVGLVAAAGLVEEQWVEPSIDYLQREIATLTSPRSLCWATFALTAWNRLPPGWNLTERFTTCLELQQKYGPFDTPALSMIAIALERRGDLLGFLSEKSSL